jgi:hypothetical protein
MCVVEHDVLCILQHSVSILSATMGRARRMNGSRLLFDSTYCESDMLAHDLDASSNIARAVSEDPSIFVFSLGDYAILTAHIISERYHW